MQVKKNITVKYEARLNRNIKRNVYGGNKVYKKGKVIWSCSERLFKQFKNKEHMEDYFDTSICEGHGVYEYFDLQKDIEFVAVKKETIVKTSQKPIKLNKKFWD